MLPEELFWGRLAGLFGGSPEPPDILSVVMGTVVARLDELVK